MFADDFRSVAEMHVQAMNNALQGIAADRVRLHLCWGNTGSPHVREVPLAREDQRAGVFL
jgi:5-methyltetrahydropteroyltriglutamate--homocysteine methyltransferase